MHLTEVGLPRVAFFVCRWLQKQKHNEVHSLLCSLSLSVALFSARMAGYYMEYESGSAYLISARLPRKRDRISLSLVFIFVWCCFAASLSTVGLLAIHCLWPDNAIKAIYARTSSASTALYCAAVHVPAFVFVLFLSLMLVHRRLRSCQVYFHEPQIAVFFCKHKMGKTCGV